MTRNPADAPAPADHSARAHGRSVHDESECLSWLGISEAGRRGGPIARASMHSAPGRAPSSARHGRRISPAAWRAQNAGYGVSTISVLLLALPAWKSASGNVWLMACLVAGVAAAILGMALRWWSYRTERDEQ